MNPAAGSLINGASLMGGLEMQAGENSSISGGLLEQIVTASSLLEAARQDGKRDDNDSGSDFTSGDVGEEDDEEEDEEEEFFEDGDESVGEELSGEEQSGVAAVLTELSQAATANSNLINSNNNNNNNNTSASASNIIPSNTNNPNPSSRPNHLSATINSISSILQSHLGTLPHPQQPHKVRLSGPIRANVNIRHGVWAPRLRCRKRKNLHAKDGIWIHPNCTLEHLVGMVRAVLPDEFEWDPQGSPLRYQAVNDQSLQSLKTVSGTVASGQSLFAAFDLVRNRRSDGDNFILQLYVYGTWTVLLKPHLMNSSISGQLDEELPSLQPPPKKRYQQTHYTQQQQQQQQQQHYQQQVSDSSPPSNPNNSNIPNNPNNPSSLFLRQLPLPHLPQTTAAPFYSNNLHHHHHPLAANPPVTFLPTVTLEMKINDTFVPVEVTRRSFIAAFRACSIPKQQPHPQSHPQQKEDVSNTSNNGNPISSNNSNNNINNNNTITTPYTPSPPPSDA